MSPRDLERLIQPCVDRIGGLMVALRKILDREGFIDPACVPQIADLFNLSQAEVRGVISFYHDFKTKPPAKNLVRICQAEACQAQGARALTKKIEQRLSIPIGDRTQDDNVALDAVYCLGLCALGPSMEINGRLIARATEGSLEKIGC